jgi:hypothetical protein
MTVDSVVWATLRVLQEKGKSLIGSDFGRNKLSLRVPSCPGAPPTTDVPAELHLNWVNAACGAVGDRGQSYWLLGPVTQTAKI